jgi:predicted transcriptional regulator
MPRPKPTRPTDFELSILSVLWKKDATILDIWSQLKGGAPKLGRTTVSKIVEVMTDKGLLEPVKPIKRPCVYRAATTREQTQKKLVEHLVRTAFGGDKKELAKLVR